MLLVGGNRLPDGCRSRPADIEQGSNDDGCPGKQWLVNDGENNDDRTLKSLRNGHCNGDAAEFCRATCNKPLTTIVVGTPELRHQKVNSVTKGMPNSNSSMQLTSMSSSRASSSSSSSSSSTVSSSACYNGDVQSSSSGQPALASLNVGRHIQNGVGSEHHTRTKSPVKCTSPKSLSSHQGRFHKLFPDIAGTDTVIKSYHCAYVSDILLQGSLYITENWICFYSKLLGKKRIRISVASVANITKKKTAMFIPNAVGIYTDSNQYVFGSLMSRDSTYRLLSEVWQQKKQGPENSSFVDVDGSVESTVDMDSVVTTKTANSISSSEDLVASSSSEDNFLSDVAGECNMFLIADSSSQSEICQVISTHPDNPPPTRKPTIKREYDDLLVRHRNATLNAPSPQYFNLHCLTMPFGRLYRVLVGMIFAMLREPSDPSWCSIPSNIYLIHLISRWSQVACLAALSGVQLKNLSGSVCSTVAWIRSLPRTSIFLLVSSFLVFVLLLSAGILSYQLFHLQAQLDHGSILHDKLVAGRNGDLNCDDQSENCIPSKPYNSRTSTVLQMHQVLEAHIQLLDRVNEALKGLYTGVLSDSFLSNLETVAATGHQEPHLEKDAEL